MWKEFIHDLETDLKAPKVLLIALIIVLATLALSSCVGARKGYGCAATRYSIGY
jgi:hypothetical protein